MQGYSTIQIDRKDAGSALPWPLLLACAAFCVAAGAVVSHPLVFFHAAQMKPVSSSSSSTKPMSSSSSSTASSIMLRLGQPSARMAVTSQSFQGDSVVTTEPEPALFSRGPLGAAAGGVAVTVLSAVAAILLKLFASKSAVQRYQSAEAHWACAAATAFVGTKAPDFKATAVFDQEFSEIQLSQYKSKKYVVLFFYPLDFTFVCPTEITAFSDRAAEFEALNTQILGVSVDSQFSHLAWIQTPRKEGGLGEIKYPLVADLKKEIAEAYGVLTEDGIALRGLFIIDKEGVIQHATINNLAFGRNVDETLRTLEALQYVQANPDEVCPAGWKKGDKTMKPDPVGSKEYFKAI